MDERSQVRPGSTIYDYDAGDREVWRGWPSSRYFMPILNISVDGYCNYREERQTSMLSYCHAFLALTANLLYPYLDIILNPTTPLPEVFFKTWYSHTGKVDFIS